VEELLVTRGQPAFMLDGDNLRHALCSDLGFSERDRAENVRRAGEAARLFAESGAVALVSLISPCAAERRKIRELHADDDLPFIEVYVNTPIEECERRDPKGLYAKARSGNLAEFTGIGAGYEPPVNPDLEADARERRDLRSGPAGRRSLDGPALADLIHCRPRTVGVTIRGRSPRWVEAPGVYPRWVR
jgi:adenylyl-sulfate kinase